jgi:phosphate transport system permease protein
LPRSLRARRAADRAFTALVALASLAVVLPLFHILYTVTVRGAPVVAEAGLSFFTETPAPPGSERLGGIAPALAGSLWLGLLSAAIGIPVGALLGIFLYEFRDSRIAGPVRAATLSLLEIPTILVGMLVYAAIVVPMGGFSVLAGAVAVSIVIIPYVATYVERALDSVPRTYREAGLALGMTRARVVFTVVAGIARRGILAGVLLGLAKAVGETAPLLFTVGSARSYVPLNPLAPGDAVPLLIFQFIATPYGNWQDLAWGAAFILTLAVLLVFVSLRVVVREVRI